VAEITWKLKTYLRTHDIKPRQVENEVIRLGYEFGRNTIYRLLSGEGPANVNRGTLAKIIAALRSITGEQVQVSDLLEYRD